MQVRKSRREEYSEATRAALIDSASDLFAQKGFAKTSLDEVAAAARVTKGALYWYFPSKQALFRAVLVQQETMLVCRLGTVAGEHADPWEGVVVALREFLDACCNSAYGRLVMREGPVVLTYAEWRECVEPYSYALCRAMLQQLIDAGILKPTPLEVGARVVHGMLGTTAVLIAESEEDSRAQVRADAETVILQLFEGALLR